jgi:hypothetical protein
MVRSVGALSGACEQLPGLGILYLRVQKLLYTVEHFLWNVFRTDSARGTYGFFVSVQKGKAIGAAV